MNFIIFKGDDIINVVPTLKEAKEIAIRLLPENYKQGDKIGPMLRISIYQFVEEFGV